jgi:hypothetical protein
LSKEAFHPINLGLARYGTDKACFQGTLHTRTRAAPDAIEGLSMRVFLFVVGIFIGAAGGFAGGVYLFSQKPDQEIVFAKKSFWDHKPAVIGEGYVSFSGTVTGAGVGYPNNTYSYTCFEDRKECWSSYIEQIGGNQIGRMDAPTPHPIVRWTPNEIVAIDEASASTCVKLTMTIDRRREQVLLLQEPVNQTKPICKDADTKTYKWTIEDSPGWQKIFGK